MKAYPSTFLGIKTSVRIHSYYRDNMSVSNQKISNWIFNVGGGLTIPIGVCLGEIMGLGPNFARLDGGTIKKEVQMRKYGTF